MAKKKILAVVDDLLFTVKISDAAKRVGLDVEFLKSAHAVVEKATHEKPLLIILDLNNNSVEPLPLISKLKDNYKDDHLDVTVAVASSPKDIPEEDLKPKIFITGEVQRPGSYVVRQETTLMQAIALAGGVGPFAAKRRIQVRRQMPGGDETIFMFDYKAYEAGGDLDGNIALRAGDIIMVPERGLLE